MFSKACEYGIRATLYVAAQAGSGERIGLKEIARQTGSPEAFTAKILRQLVEHNIIQSVKGPSGGFEIKPEKLKRISIKQIVCAIDGGQIFVKCGMGLKNCSDKRPCPIHHQYQEVREKLEKLMESSRLSELAPRLQEIPYCIKH